MEDLIKLMVERWYLPEEQVRQFMAASFGAEGSGLNLDQIREITANLLQDLILNSIEEK